MVPIPGTTQAARLDENLAAADLVLTADELRQLDDGSSRITAAGERYAPQQLRMIDR